MAILVDPQLTYRRINPNLHVRNHKDEGAVTPAFDVRVPKKLDRFYLLQAVDDLPKLGSKETI